MDHSSVETQENRIRDLRSDRWTVSSISGCRFPWTGPGSNPGPRSRGSAGSNLHGVVGGRRARDAEGADA